MFTLCIASVTNSYAILPKVIIGQKRAFVLGQILQYKQIKNVQATGNENFYVMIRFEEFKAILLLYSIDDKEH